MIFGLLDKDPEPFARELAKDLASRLPPARLGAAKDSDKKLKSATERALSHMENSAATFHRAQKVGMLKRLRITRTFQDEMAALGYEDAFIRQATMIVVRALTTKKR